MVKDLKSEISEAGELDAYKEEIETFSDKERALYESCLAGQKSIAKLYGELIRNWLAFIEDDKAREEKIRDYETVMGCFVAGRYKSGFEKMLESFIEVLEEE
jgi:hypothetical protein